MRILPHSNTHLHVPGQSGVHVWCIYTHICIFKYIHIYKYTCVTLTQMDIFIYLYLCEPAQAPSLPSPRALSRAQFPCKSRNDEWYKGPPGSHTNVMKMDRGKMECVICSFLVRLTQDKNDNKKLTGLRVAPARHAWCQIQGGASWYRPLVQPRLFRRKPRVAPCQLPFYLSQREPALWKTRQTLANVKLVRG